MSAPELKPVPLAHKAEAALVRAALALFRALPIATASRLSGGLAKTIGPLIPVSKVADRNLQAAMPELDASRAQENRRRSVGESRQHGRRAGADRQPA